VGALTERRGAGAQLGLGLAAAGEDQVRVVEAADRVDHDVIALLRMKAGDAPDGEGVRRDAELGADPRPSLLAEGDLVGPHRVGQVGDLVRVDAGRDHRLAGALGDRQHRRDSAAGAGVEPPSRPGAHLPRDRAPLGPGESRSELRRQARGQKLLLLVMQQQQVIGKLRRQRGREAAAQ
jgi:hypothetical protein